MRGKFISILLVFLISTFLFSFILVSSWSSSALHEVINRSADGGVTALHMAALNGHVESVQLLLDLGASVTEVTMEDGTTIDLIGNSDVLFTMSLLVSNGFDANCNWGTTAKSFLTGSLILQCSFIMFIRSPISPSFSPLAQFSLFNNYCASIAFLFPLLFRVVFLVFKLPYHVKITISVRISCLLVVWYTSSYLLRNCT